MKHHRVHDGLMGWLGKLICILMYGRYSCPMEPPYQLPKRDRTFPDG